MLRRHGYSPNLPSDPPEVRRIPRVTQMYPPSDSSSSRAALGTGPAGRGARAPPAPRLYEVEPPRRSKYLCLALQLRIVGRMFCEDFVEDGEEARVALERVGCGRDGGCGANCKGWVRGYRVEVGEQRGVGCLREWENFLEGEVRSKVRGLLSAVGWPKKLTMLGLEANVDKPRTRAQNCRAGNNRVVNILERRMSSFEAAVISCLLDALMG